MLRNRPIYRTFARLRQFTGLVLLTSAGGLGGIAAVQADSPSEKWSLRPLCVLWDSQAGEAITRRVQDGTDDFNLRRLGESIFRMRRARHSCKLGLIRMACQDYIAIIRDVPGISTDWTGSHVVCPLAMADESKSASQQTQATDK